MLVHPYPIMRNALAELIGKDSSFRVVTQLASCRECVTYLKDHDSDVVVCAPPSNSRCATADARNQVGSLSPLRELFTHNKPVLGLVDYANELEVIALLQFGFSGLLTVGAPLETFHTAIRNVSRGECFLDAEAQSIVVREAARRRDLHLDLSSAAYNDRERRVLNLLVSGKSNDEIAESIFVSEATVKKCLRTLLRKLGVSNRIGLIALAVALVSMMD